MAKNSSVNRRGRPPKASSKKLISKVSELYSKGFKASQIARMQGFTVSYVARIIRKLKEENPSIIYVHQRGETPEQKGDFVNKNSNVHAQKIRAFVHMSSDKYRKSCNLFFKDFVEGVDVQCQNKFIYVYSNKKKFFAESEQKAMWNSLSFWNDVLLKIEDRLGVLIFKKGCKAFEFVYAEWETQDSAVAIDAEKKGYVWRVFHTDDGKLRLSVDWSEKTPNHETHHARDGHVDSVTFNRHVNSILDNPQAPTFAELSKVVNAIAAQNLETAEGLGTVVDVLKATFKRRESPKDFKEDQPILDYFG